MWETLRNKISELPPFVDLSGRLASPGTVARAGGLTGSSRSLVLSALVPYLGRGVVALASDPVRARDIAADLEHFGAGRVVFYPEDEILPYDYHDPDRNLTGMQMAALAALVEKRCDVLVCTPRSLLKKVFAPEIFLDLLTDLRTGEEKDPYELGEGLVSLGYERHGIVEEKGQFALRGGIFDLFEVTSPDPVRMEFDGDEITSIRTFDIETQRSIKAVDSIRIHPLHHLAPDEEGIERLGAFLEKESAGLAEEKRKKMMLPAERLAAGIHFFGMEHYAAVVHDVVPVTDYWDSPPLMALYDCEEIEALTEEFREEIQRRHGRAGDENIYPRPDLVYAGGPEWGATQEACGRLAFTALTGGDDVRFSTSAVGDYRRNIKGLVTDVRRELDSGRRVFLFCANEIQRERAEDILSEVALEIDFPIGEISSGFKWPDTDMVFLSEEEVFGRFHRPWHSTGARSRSLVYDPSHFKPGDFVVHVSHGIGRYMGMRVLEIEASRTECLDIRYEKDDRLFIPVSQLRMVEKYTAAEGAQPALAKLGSGVWNRTREKARKSAGLIAQDLIDIYAARHMADGFAFGPDKPWQKEMEASFPWEETPHQLQASSEVKTDMESMRPMDRLLCGDVGFGKTEVAVRATFKAVVEGKQAAILVPTTVLALQHYNTFRERLVGFPVNIGMLSRFVPAAGRKKVVEGVALGEIDILIGTHRLLSKDIEFSDLGLVVVDEEHRFGVAQKERLKKMKKTVDVLSMTATPIPRTLSMAISGIRDISVIDTPPRNRLPIHTEILPFDDERIREAVMREIGRGGQVFFVHNRVQSIEVMEGYLARLLPDRVRIAHAHGQMKERELEKIMIDFVEKKFDVLLTTMIIEAGLDFPNVNTIIINRSDRFGLAQLYQLRGRVGRSDRKAYAYLLIPKGGGLTSTAIKRLQAITEFDYLGAGYRIAMRDLEIRGAGNFLGHQQSGQISAVGLDLYSRMIKNEVSRRRGETVEEEPEARISVPVPAYLPDSYVTDSEERMDIYRRLSRVRGLEEVAAMRSELLDRFGVPPPTGENMLKLIEFRARASAAGLDSMEVDAKGVVKAAFTPQDTPPRKLIAEIARKFEGRLTFHMEKGFSITLLPPGNEKYPDDDLWSSQPGAADLESLLNLLEFFDK
ncbi:MAG: transcription-repair coupling factor [Candidatus Krumholzibacteria bacterium]|nr:transcription-repair coupling factor [Candidatus Krumholzibacteria bacterium]